jgi:hypothetical protein
MIHLVMIGKLLHFQNVSNWSNIIKMLHVVPRYPTSIGFVIGPFD